MTSTISNTTNDIFDINDDSPGNLNFLVISSEEQKMIDKSTSMQSINNLPFHDYLYEFSSKPPPIECVKSFLNRFLTDLAKEKHERSLNTGSNSYQRNTNFVHYDSNCLGQCEKLSFLNKSIDRLSNNTTNDLDMDFVAENVLLKPSILIGESENELIYNCDTKMDFQQLLNQSANRLCSVILNNEIKRAAKKQVKSLRRELRNSKYQVYNNRQITNSDKSVGLPNEAEIIFYEEKYPELPSDVKETVVNVDENSTFRSQSRNASSRNSLFSYNHELANRVATAANHCNTHSIQNHNVQIHVPKVPKSGFYSEVSKPLKCHCENLQFIPDQENPDFSNQKAFTKPTAFLNKLFNKSKKRLRNKLQTDNRRLQNLSQIKMVSNIHNRNLLNPPLNLNFNPWRSLGKNINTTNEISIITDKSLNESQKSTRNRKQCEEVSIEISSY